MSDAPFWMVSSPTSIPPMNTDTLVMAAPNSTKRNAQFALFGSKTGKARGDRRHDDGFDVEMRGARGHVDIAHRRLVGEHDMDIDAQPVGVQPDRVWHAANPIQRIERRLDMQRHLAASVDIGAAGLQAAGRHRPA